MDDFNFWWYIIAAVIYFLTRGKKKKQKKPSRQGSESAKPQGQRPKTFEELLREITEGPQEEEIIEEEEPIIASRTSDKGIGETANSSEATFRTEGRRRSFADDESKRVYEESIKMAEGADLKFETNEKLGGSSLLKENLRSEESPSYAQELMDGFDLDEAKKAIIYTEIFTKKY